MRKASEIIHENCKPYGGYANVITKCGGTLVMQIMEKSAHDYAEEYLREQEKGKKTLEDRKADFANRVNAWFEFDANMRQEFISYWTEHSDTGKKMRFEKQPVFDIKKRLLTWKKNSKKFDNGNSISKSNRDIEALKNF